ncbi:MAG: hypothetical protein M1393_05410 [Candidatus Thermoplasmatota archaeon]|nr:hypothetical protein [Candidatus Thermoplasmatota archaeon]MCL6090461.1 hypothetical protein [Candidatus Thermoplasmatota archaeon]MDA8142941.1 hypothetical protein [Thermoplasmatales archaeon]
MQNDSTANVKDFNLIEIHIRINMAKALFYIIAGENEKARAIMGLNMAKRAFEFKRFDDVKVLLQGPSEKMIIDEAPEVKEIVDYLIKNKVIDSACKFIAENLSIVEPILKRGVDLKPAGERLSALVNSGFVPLIF